MTRLLVHVEGETEETFVNEVLRDHLTDIGYTSVSARIVGNARERHRRGGVRAWSVVKKDIVRHLRNDQACISTTMVDYYGLPSSGSGAWPGRALATAASVNQKPTVVQTALTADLAPDLSWQEANRFVPFVILHEFEGLLFSDCAVFGESIGQSSIIAKLQAVRDQFHSPEEINDSPQTAPSKRVLALFPAYQKPLHGNVAALEIGLQKIRGECPHFNTWLATLEAHAL